MVSPWSLVRTAVKVVGWFGRGGKGVDGQDSDTNPNELASDNEPWHYCTPDKNFKCINFQRPKASISPSNSLTSQIWTAVGRFNNEGGRVRTTTVFIKTLNAIELDRQNALGHDASGVKSQVAHQRSLAVMQKRLEMEVDLLRQLQHPIVAPVLGYQKGDALFSQTLIISAHSSTSLASWLHRKSPNGSQKLAMLKSLADGLIFLAHRTIFHGDLSPETIMIDAKGNAVLIDFGLYVISKEGIIINPEDYRPGNVPGQNVRWYSQERLRAEQYSIADDVYAFGCIILFTLSGLQPYHRAIRKPEFWMRRSRGELPSSPALQEPDVKIPAKSLCWPVMYDCWKPAKPSENELPPVPKGAPLRPSMDQIYMDFEKVLVESSFF